MSEKGVPVVIDLCSGAEYTAGATHAVLFVTRSITRMLREKMELFGGLRKEHENLSEIRFFFGNPEYCGIGLEDVVGEGEPSEAFEKAFAKAAEEIDNRHEDHKWAFLDPSSGMGPDSRWVPDRYNVRTELDELVVASDKSFHFCCVIKHTDAALQTEEITLSDVLVWEGAIDRA